MISGDIIRQLSSLLPLICISRAIIFNIGVDFCRERVYIICMIKNKEEFIVMANDSKRLYITVSKSGRISLKTNSKNHTNGRSIAYGYTDLDALIAHHEERGFEVVV